MQHPVPVAMLRTEIEIQPWPAIAVTQIGGPADQPLRPGGIGDQVGAPGLRRR